MRPLFKPLETPFNPYGGPINSQPDRQIQQDDDGNGFINEELRALCAAAGQDDTEDWSGRILDQIIANPNGDTPAQSDNNLPNLLTEGSYPTSVGEAPTQRVNSLQFLNRQVGSNSEESSNLRESQISTSAQLSLRESRQISTSAQLNLRDS